MADKNRTKTQVQEKLSEAELLELEEYAKLAYLIYKDEHNKQKQA